jgi:predicted metal-dependent HD superfamily phosphohydrolase
LNHDRRYDVRRKDNEEVSAGMARYDARALGLQDLLVDAAEIAVMATKSHQSSVPDTRYLIDADLSILGYDEEAFDRYEDGVRSEYRAVYSDKEISVGRAVWLGKFLDAHPDRIYYTDEFEERYGMQARANLTRSLAKLQAS